MAFVNWVENSVLGIWMVDSLWAYPIVLSTHAVGMSIVVGTVVMIDLRLLGYAGDAPLDSFKSMFAVTWAWCCIEFSLWCGLVHLGPGEVFLSFGFSGQRLA